jgi:hypothetical protein
MKKSLIDKVVEQVEKDVMDGDLTAIYELLSKLPEKYLLGYLPMDLQIDLHDPEIGVEQIRYKRPETHQEALKIGRMHIAKTRRRT